MREGVRSERLVLDVWTAIKIRRTPLYRGGKDGHAPQHNTHLTKFHEHGVDARYKSKNTVSKTELCPQEANTWKMGEKFSKKWSKFARK